MKELQDRFESIVRRRKLIGGEDDLLSKELEKVESELLEEMIQNGQQNIKTETGMTLFRATDKFVSEAEGVSKQELVEILANQPQFQDIVKTSVDLRTLRTRLREIEENNEQLPDEVVRSIKVYEKERVRFRS